MDSNGSKNLNPYYRDGGPKASALGGCGCSSCSQKPLSGLFDDSKFMIGAAGAVALAWLYLREKWEGQL